MLRSLQACRAAAALLVVLYHTSEGIVALPKYFAARPFGPLFAFGGAGVDFFFVLSGFIIAHVHAGDIGRPERLRAYLTKRLTRIYPTYWAVLLPLIAVFLAVPSFGKGHERNPLVMLCSLLLLPLPGGEPVLVVSWSLCYELFFYLLFAVLIASRRWGGALVLAWLTVVGARMGGTLDAFPWTFLGGPYQLEFLAGILLALALKHYTIPGPRCLAACGVALFLLTGMVEVYVRPLSMSEHVLGFMGASVLIMAGVIQAERSGLLHAPAWLVFLGDASYSIYLVHFPALSVLAKVAQKLRLDSWMPSPVLFCLLAAAAVGVGCLFHVAIERPLLTLMRRRTARGVGIAAPERRAA